MKKIFLSALMLTPFLLSAQSNIKKYNSKLTQMIAVLNEKDTTEKGWIYRANGFKFLATTQKTDWHPYYYNAYCLMNAAFKEKSAATIDSLGVIINSALSSAVGLKGDASEIYSLVAFSDLALLSANPMERALTYSRKIMETLDKAQNANPNNPRVYYIRAVFLKNMPTQFGGGKGPAKKQIELAKQKFDAKQIAPDSFDPNWGKEEVENLYTELGTEKTK